MSSQREIRLNAFDMNCVGHQSPGLWSHPRDRSWQYKDLDYWVDLARLLERGKFDGLFIADVLGIYDVLNGNGDAAIRQATQVPVNDPLALITPMALVTEHLGFGLTASLSFEPPYPFARRLSTLDHLTKGRVGWNIVTSYLESGARNIGHQAQTDHDARYDYADEYLDVVKGLWDSWEGDAFIRNKESGKFFDASKLHTLDHHGDFFQVSGPLNIGRTPQGRPIVFQAGASDDGKKLAAKHADAIFTHHDTREEAQAFYRDVKQQLESHGRRAEDLHIFQGVSVIVGDDADDVEQQYQTTAALVSIDDALNYLGRYFEHHDFSQYTLDAPFPDIGDLGKNSFRSTTDEIKRNARERNLTLRQVALEAASPRPRFSGTPEQVADGLQAWFEEKAADGFIIQGGTPDTFPRFVDQVVPVLQARGLFRTDYPGTTLRESLGLDEPKNQFTQQ